MNVAVCVRRVLDPEARLKLTEGGGLETEGVALVLDPVDAAALEAGVQVCEAQGGGVTAISIGDEESDEALRTALAQGAERAVRITGLAPATGSEAGAALAAAVKELGSFDLVLCGARSSDHQGGATGATLAARLGVPVVQNVVAIDEVSEGIATVQRRRDGGFREVVQVQLPAVLTAEALVAQPRFPTTQARLRANRAEIETLDGGALGAAGAPAAARELGYRSPPPRLSGILWPDEELDARDRLRFLVQGGAQRSGSGARAVTGTPEEVASALATYFRESGLAETS